MVVQECLAQFAKVFRSPRGAYAPVDADSEAFQKQVDTCIEDGCRDIGARFNVEILILPTDD